MWALLYLLAYGLFGWIALFQGLVCLWRALDIYAWDAIHIPYPIISDSLSTLHQYLFVGSVLVIIGFLTLWAAWELIASDGNGRPEDYISLLRKLSWLIKRVAPISFVALFGFSHIDIRQIKPGAWVFLLLSAAIWVLSWDVEHDKKASEGKYALLGQSLMSTPGARLFVLSAISVLTVVGINTAEPWDEQYRRANAATYFTVSMLKNALDAKISLSGRLPRDQDELLLIVKIALEGSSLNSPYRRGPGDDVVHVTLTYVKDSSGPYTSMAGALEPSVLYCAVDRDLKKYWLTATILDGFVGTKGAFLPDDKDPAKPAVYSGSL
jgi:hypothetical protein